MSANFHWLRAHKDSSDPTVLLELRRYARDERDSNDCLHGCTRQWCPVHPPHEADCNESRRGNVFPLSPSEGPRLHLHHQLEFLTSIEGEGRQQEMNGDENTERKDASRWIIPRQE
jgi:hypothetical protein